MNSRRLYDLVASRLMLLATFLLGMIVIVIAAVLLYRSLPILEIKPLTELLLSSSWSPSKGDFGFYPFIMGTIWVTAIAMAIAIPLSLLTSIYIAEYAPSRLRNMLKPMVELLAGIPSVVFGLWGVLVIVPLVRDFVAPAAGVTTTGYNLLSGGIILAIMVFPIIISVSEEVMRTVPREIHEASTTLGATRWQTVKSVVLRSTLPGIAAAVVLGFGRAFGETMAVLMVVGNVPKVPSSVFDPAYPIPALIANNYGEMMSIPLYDSALLFSALILLVSVVIFSMLAEVIISRFKRRYAIE
jgi:phosphate transport system permease protein